MPEPMTEHAIHARCRAIIGAGVRRAYDAALADFERLVDGVGVELAGPVMAAAFSQAIQHGCAVLGAVRDGLPDVARFEPNEHAFALLPPAVPVQARIEAWRIHRVMARRAREFVGARAAGDAAAMGVAYDRAAASEGVRNFLFMLWATAMVVQRAVDAAAAVGNTCPTCQAGAGGNCAAGEPAARSCGHVGARGDAVDLAAFEAGRQKMWDQVSAILRDGDAR